MEDISGFSVEADSTCSVIVGSTDQLVGIPPMEKFESPASWISRAALSQGVTVRQLRSFLGMPKSTDFDLEFASVDIERLAYQCGLPTTSFRFSVHMLRGVTSLDPGGRRFLGFSGKNSRYRFCPVCLKEHRVTAFMLHWRFYDWLYCPLHACLMESDCSHCGSALTLPVDLMSQKVPLLQFCASCNKRLYGRWKSAQKEFGAYSLSILERWILEHGRAVLAAFLRRRIWISGPDRPIELPFASLKSLNETGLLLLVNPNRDLVVKLRHLRNYSELEVGDYPFAI